MSDVRDYDYYLFGFTQQYHESSNKFPTADILKKFIDLVEVIIFAEYVGNLSNDIIYCVSCNDADEVFFSMQNDDCYLLCRLVDERIGSFDIQEGVKRVKFTELEMELGNLFEDNSIKRIDIVWDSSVEPSPVYEAYGLYEKCETNAATQYISLAEGILEKLHITGKRASWLYNEACISAQTYHNIISQNVIHPRKENVLALLVTLRCTNDEIKSLMYSAGYSYPDESLVSTTVFNMVENRTAYSSNHFTPLMVINDELIKLESPVLLGQVYT